MNRNSWWTNEGALAATLCAMLLVAGSPASGGLLLSDDFDDGTLADWTTGGPGAGSVTVSGGRAVIPGNNISGTYIEHTFDRTADPELSFTFDWEPGAYGQGLQAKFSLVDSRSGASWDYLASAHPNMGAGNGYWPGPLYGGGAGIPLGYPHPNNDSQFTMKVNTETRTAELYNGSNLVAQYVSPKGFNSNDKPQVVDTVRLYNSADFNVGKSFRFDNVEVTGSDRPVAFDDDFADQDYTVNPVWTPSVPGSTEVDSGRRLILRGGPNGHTVGTSFSVPQNAKSVTVEFDTYQWSNWGSTTYSSFFLTDSTTGKRIGIYGANDVINWWGGMTLSGDDVTTFDHHSGHNIPRGWTNWRFEVDLLTQVMEVYRNESLVTWSSGLSAVPITLETVNGLEFKYDISWGQTSWNLYYDNVLVTFTPGDVVIPEPSVVSLLGLAGLFVSCRRRR